MSFKRLLPVWIIAATKKRWAEYKSKKAA